MSDLISRQTLLNKFEPWLKVKDYNDGELNMLKAVLYEIRFMTSATDTNVGTKLGIDPYKIERAIRGLTEWQKHVQTESDIDRDISVAVEALKAQLGTDLAEVGTDCISRQAAIDEANAWLLDCLKVNKQDRSCGLIRRLEDLPSAQPEIIRCKDCIYSGPPDEDKWLLCHHDGAQWNEENHYCGYAERREVTE